MKNKHLIAGFALLLLCSTGCDWRGIRGNGQIKTEPRPVTDFTRIDAGGFYDITWHPGAPSLTVATDGNLLSHIETVVRGNILKIEMHDTLSPTEGVKIVITTPSLGGAELSGALRLEASPLAGDRFTLDTRGACKVTLEGRVDRLVASLTGASKLQAASLQTNDVELAVTGAGKAEVFASNMLKAAITGAGNVTYGGNPKTVEKRVTGAGKIRPKN